MNLRCMYCQTMFGLGRENMLIALQAMDAENLSHFDFHCPKCRRANRVERKKLELANPNWQEKVKEMAKEAAKVEKAASEAKPAKGKTASKAAAKPAPSKKTASTSSPKGKAKAK
ncbi:MAG: hypothetical protein JW963_21075 [Anaerolineales bacterium]|nr:hypothetical protein [Anaerolineales bacterium]